MGRIKTKLIKRIAKEIFSRYTNELNEDFDKNKAVIGRHTDVISKKMRNTVCGYVTRLFKNREEL